MSGIAWFSSQSRGLASQPIMMFGFSAGQLRSLVESTAQLLQGICAMGFAAEFQGQTNI